MTPLSAGWRDAWGNTFQSLVSSAYWGIIRAEELREPYRYDPDRFPSPVIRQAVRDFEEFRRQKLDRRPVPATPEDLVWEELPLLIEVFAPSNHPVAQENARRSREAIRSIEERYPGTLERIEREKPEHSPRLDLQRKGRLSREPLLDTGDRGVMAGVSGGHAQP